MHPKKTFILILVAVTVWGGSMIFFGGDLKFGRSSQLQFEQVIRDTFDDPPEEEEGEYEGMPEESGGSSAAGASAGGKQGISTIGSGISVAVDGTVTDGGIEGLTEVSMESPDAAFEISLPVGVEIAVLNTDELYSEGILSSPLLIGTNSTEPRGYVRVTEVYEVGGDSALVFSEPITLTFKLPGDRGLIDPAVFYYDEEGAKWIEIGGTIFFDNENDLAITVHVMHLTKFTVFDKDLLSHPFVDMDNNWARNYVADLWRQGVVQGRGPDHFAPDAHITRAEFTKIMLLLLKYRVPATATTTTHFQDVQGDEWYGPYLQMAYEEGIIQGYGDGTFRPNAAITRVEALSVLFRAARVDILSRQEIKEPSFPDVGREEWYSDHVEFAVKSQVVHGYNNGFFGPHDNLTRAEASKIASLGMARMLKSLGREDH